MSPAARANDRDRATAHGLEPTTPIEDPAPLIDPVIPILSADGHLKTVRAAAAGGAGGAAH